MENFDINKDKLLGLMKRLLEDKIVLAFSGGVDSALILKLGSMLRENKDDIVAIYFKTEASPKDDLANAKALAKKMDVKLFVEDISIFDNKTILANPIDRCYHCKSLLFSKALQLKEDLGYGHLVDGSNLDDYKVFRPGLRALDDKKVRSVLKESNFTKDMVRALAKDLAISVHKRPSAPCLATRFPYNTPLDISKFDLLDGGENFIKSLGITNVRLRVEGDGVRIEVDREDFPLIFENLEDIKRKLKDLGFIHLSLDLDGFRSGSMDENLSRKDKEILNPRLKDER
ncbi:MAG: ATP-dependent sacrificial sulfur transferase LarE [Anaerococcus sp.]|nr:ATP-dependent sacrificial sulfur transferase LarE [Anaerococcus sp.]